MSNLVTLKKDGFHYTIPMHEFARYWTKEPISIISLPEGIPNVSLMAALKRGKSTSRMEKAYATKGSGKHDPFSEDFKDRD